jgi:hypothetical protein
MKTPAGTECVFFYGNYFRGKSEEECRLLGPNHAASKWTRDLCFSCPVPRIKLANSCKNMVLRATIHKKMFGMKRIVKVTAECTQSHKAVDVPEIGCGECHPIQNIFNQISE